ncbi:MAG: amidohydrolase [Deltaproteobacteria bacterium]|nr:MAG: amidohydrolase [Deltaproteobacteria bacterium]
MIVDAHLHLFPPAFASRRGRLLEQEPYFATLFADPRSPLAAAEQLVEILDADGIDVALACGFPWRDAGRAREHNDYLLECARLWPGRIVALAAVDPLSPGCAREAERALAAGAAGLGEIGAYHDDLGNPAVLEPLVGLAGLCAEAGRPLLLHTNEPLGHRYPGKSPMTLGGLARLLERCPDTRFQLAHLGGGIFFFAWLRRGMHRLLHNCIADTAAQPFLYRPRVLRYLLESGVPLCLGTDWPLLRLDRYRKEFALAGLDAGSLQGLLGDTAASFWGLQQPARAGVAPG